MGIPVEGAECHCEVCVQRPFAPSPPRGLPTRVEHVRSSERAEAIDHHHPLLFTVVSTLYPHAGCDVSSGRRP